MVVANALAHARATECHATAKRSRYENSSKYLRQNSTKSNLSKICHYLRSLLLETEFRLNESITYIESKFKIWMNAEFKQWYNIMLTMRFINNHYVCAINVTIDK